MFHGNHLKKKFDNKHTSHQAVVCHNATDLTDKSFSQTIHQYGWHFGLKLATLHHATSLREMAIHSMASPSCPFVLFDFVSLCFFQSA